MFGEMELYCDHLRQGNGNRKFNLNTFNANHTYKTIYAV